MIDTTDDQPPMGVRQRQQALGWGSLDQRPLTPLGMPLTAVVVAPSPTLPWQMKRNTSDQEARSGDEDTAGVLKQRKDGEGTDWVAMLQSVSVAAPLQQDILRVLAQGPSYRVQWCGPGPDTLAFLEDLARTLRLER
jgi:hypothetical protein